MNLRKPKNIVFDVGDVLLSYRWQQMLMDYGLTEDEAYRVGRQLFDEPEHLWRTFDTGCMTEEEIISAYEKKFPKDAKVIRWFVSHGEYMSVARPSIWERVHLLKEKGYRLYILSNYSEILFRKHTEYADFMKDMDGVLVSYMIHEIKPNPAIYQTLCETYQLQPKECLFFDDRAENVQGAIAFGMQSKQVLSVKGLEEDLDILLEME